MSLLKQIKPESNDVMFVLINLSNEASRIKTSLILT